MLDGSVRVVAVGGVFPEVASICSEPPPSARIESASSSVAATRLPLLPPPATRATMSHGLAAPLTCCGTTPSLDGDIQTYVEAENTGGVNRQLAAPMHNWAGIAGRVAGAAGFPVQNSGSKSRKSN
uniref:Uncharacterized protein n=1 Tax=Oryza punctata TaxID=4537 RepID=A0A0E0KVZ8_ORYPU